MTRGAQIEDRDSNTGATPLQLVASFNYPDSVKRLVDVYKASVNATDKYMYMDSRDEHTWQHGATHGSFQR